MFWCNRAVWPWLNVCRRHACRYSNQFDQKSIRINKSNYFFSETRSCFFSHHVVLFQTLQPKPDRIQRNCERGRFDLTGPANSASSSRPRKKCQDCSRRAAIIAEIKMVGSRVIKIHRALDETQTEKPDVKIEVPLRIAGDRSDVMKSRNFSVHQGDGDVRSSSPRRFGVIRIPV